MVENTVIDGCCGSDGSYVYDGSGDSYWAAAWYVSSRTLLEIGNFAHWIRCSCSYGRSFDDGGVAPNMALVRCGDLGLSQPFRWITFTPDIHIARAHLISLEAPNGLLAQNSNRIQTTFDHSQIRQYSHMHPQESLTTCTHAIPHAFYISEIFSLQSCCLSDHVYQT
jgi:hypothetical protein